MADPEHLRTPDQLLALRERMQELHDQLETQVPERLYAIFKAHPEVLTISWTQSSLQHGTAFYLNLDELELDTPDDDSDVADWPEEHKARLENEVKTLLLSVPMTVMVHLFGHSHSVRFSADDWEAEYDD